MSLGLRMGLGLGSRRSAGASAPPGNWSATSIVDSRSGFASPLPEFDGLACPEVEDPSAMFLFFEEEAVSGSIKLGAPIFLQCELTGTFTGGTLEATGSVGGFAIDVAATLTEGALTGTVTITNGSHEEVRAFNATAGSDSVTIPSGLWVDAVNGSDANDGSSPDQALQTIDGLPTLVAGDRIYLARGSHWREMLEAQGLNGLQTYAYGIGPRPILNPYNVIQASDWTKTPGRTNVYQCTVTGEYPGTVCFSAIVLQEGWQLEPVADLDLCDANAGTHVVQSLASGTPQTIYVNLYGATKAPVDNQVEISVRPHGFRGSGSGHAVGLMARTGWATGGGIVIESTLAPKDNAYVDDCVCLHGNDHLMYVGGGEVHRTALIGCSGGTNATGMLVVYRNTIDPSDSFLLHELACLQFPQLTNATRPTPYVAHSGVSGDWLDCTLHRCYSYGLRGWTVHHGLIDECLFENCTGGNPVIGVLTIPGILTIRNTRCLGTAAGAGATQSTIQNGPGVLTIENFVSWFPNDTIAGGHIIQRGGSVNISNSTFLGGAADTVDDNTNPVSVSLSRVSAARGNRVSVNGSTITPVDFIACIATSDWRENFAASSRDFSVYRVSNAYGDCATSTETLPVYETETDPDRPIFLETAASVAARGWEIGPVQTRPGSGVSWVTPEIGPAWRTFIEGLSGPAS